MGPKLNALHQRQDNLALVIHFHKSGGLVVAFDGNDGAAFDGQKSNRTYRPFENGEKGFHDVVLHDRRNYKAFGGWLSILASPYAICTIGVYGECLPECPLLLQDFCRTTSTAAGWKGEQQIPQARAIQELVQVGLTENTNGPILHPRIAIEKTQQEPVSPAQVPLFHSPAKPRERSYRYREPATSESGR
jgi:hypothetical protein